ncbi:hypothetical protein [Nocardia macrotermitis]|uniref:DUF8020 domain-containing protein n=1 Tax=Nocardia macrotermitis TaxID=2585198 RepID=A0A7K0D7I8_9NOCA|nr:hypothetical protein [Nocardia macrotermitis]MQY21677.1 hypothetical protein [Nocardia macrotermitis]
MRRDGNAIALDVTGGTLRLDDSTVTIVAADGSPVAALLLHLNMGDRTTDLGTHVDRTHLVARVSAEDIGHWELTSPRQRSISAGIALGALGGIATGIFIAVVLGVLSGGVLIPLAFPIGIAAVAAGIIGGMIIGGISGASIPNSDVPDQWQYQQECHYIGNYDYEYCY